MDQATTTTLAFLFVICLPLCFYSATLGVLSAGFLGRIEDQPATFRLFTWMMRQEGEAEYSVGGILGALLGLGVANLVPAYGLVAHKNGVGPVVVELLYFLAVGLWAANIISAIRQTRAARGPTRKKGAS